MTGRNSVPQLELYRDWLASTLGMRFADYEALWRWSVTDLEAFWGSIWAYDGVDSAAPFEAVLAVERMPGAVWFKGAQVNYAHQVFKHVAAAEAAGQPAIIAENEAGEVRTLGWRELERQVASLAATLRELGIARGDRVAAYLPNVPESVVAFLACASVGAVWSVCAPDMGLQAIVDRFAQIEPHVLIAVDGVRYAGKSLDRVALVGKLRAALPSLHATIVMETGHAATKIRGDRTFAAAISRSGALEPEWLPFDHPIWVVYSSGTTGLPKPIVHGQGGMILTGYATLKHCDLGASYSGNNFGERFHWFATTGWVMWNIQVSALLLGTTICLFDGSPSGPRDKPDFAALWRFAARQRITFFGSGAAFYANCMKASLELSDCGDLSAVRALGSTGSPLSPEVQAWGTRQFERVGTPDIWWYNTSGGTDISGGFCAGNRELPQVPGEMQCRQVGAAIEAWNEAGQPVIDEVGELVCTRPMPGMPLYFWGDSGDARYLSSYFDVYPGIWRHGDWIKITARGTCIIYGRSDATINRHGHRMGTSELYAAVEKLPEVLDSLVLDLEYLGRPSRLLMFVALRSGCTLDAALEQRIQTAIRTDLSPRFSPDAIIQAPEIPRTLTGKKQEAPMKKLFLGHPAEKVINRDAMLNPQCIPWYLEQARREIEAAG